MASKKLTLAVNGTAIPSGDCAGVVRSLPLYPVCLANHYQHIMDVAARHRVQFQMPETDAVAMLKNL